jgi:hypothetical protein
VLKGHFYSGAKNCRDAFLCIFVAQGGKPEDLVVGIKDVFGPEGELYLFPP